MKKLIVGFLALALSAPVLALPISIQGFGAWEYTSQPSGEESYDLGLTLAYTDAGSAYTSYLPTGFPGMLVPNAGDVEVDSNGVASSANWDFGNGLEFIVNSVSASFSGTTGIIRLMGVMELNNSFFRNEQIVVTLNQSTYSYATVPEPTSIALFLLGVVALVAMRKRSLGAPA